MVAFKSLEELYNRLTPAINTKITELRRNGYNNIKNIDIWLYCIENNWNKKRDLRIHEMVNDILNIDEFKLNIFLKRKQTKEDINE